MSQAPQLRRTDKVMTDECVEAGRAAGVVLRRTDEEVRAGHRGSTEELLPALHHIEVFALTDERLTYHGFRWVESPERSYARSENALKVRGAN